MGKALDDPDASLRGHPGRREGLRQDRRHQQPAGKGRHADHRRRHELHLPEGTGTIASASACAKTTRLSSAKELMAKAKEKGVKLLLPVDNVSRRQLQQRRQAHHRVRRGRHSGRLRGHGHRTRRPRSSSPTRSANAGHRGVERPHGRVRVRQLRRGHHGRGSGHGRVRGR